MPAAAAMPPAHGARRLYDWHDDDDSGNDSPAAFSTVSVGDLVESRRSLPRAPCAVSRWPKRGSGRTSAPSRTSRTDVLFGADALLLGQPDDSSVRQGSRPHRGASLDLEFGDDDRRRGRTRSKESRRRISAAGPPEELPTTRRLGYCTCLGARRVRTRCGGHLADGRRRRSRPPRPRPQLPSGGLLGMQAPSLSHRRRRPRLCTRSMSSGSAARRRTTSRRPAFSFMYWMAVASQWMASSAHPNCRRDVGRARQRRRRHGACSEICQCGLQDVSRHVRTVQRAQPRRGGLLAPAWRGDRRQSGEGARRCCYPFDGGTMWYDCPPIGTRHAGRLLPNVRRVEGSRASLVLRNRI